MTEIFVDADACPVKEEVFKVAARYGLKTFVVSNGGIRPSRDPQIEHVLVSGKFDAADDWIADHITAGDVVVTSDIPLAARAVDLGCRAVSASGREFTQQNIGSALAAREVSQHVREATQTQTRHRPFDRRDRANFLQTLDRVVQQLAHASGN